jgi:hypothetical protein
MIAAGTLLLMALTGLVFWREGLLTAVTMLVNVGLAGAAAFSLGGPLAGLLEARTVGTALAGYEDGLCLMVVFALTLAGLRLTTHLLAPRQLDYPPLLQRGGALVFGLATAYLAAGFLVCVLETLPWPEHALFAERRAGTREVLAPDRVWQAFLPGDGARP